MKKKDLTILSNDNDWLRIDTYSRIDKVSTLLNQSEERKRPRFRIKKNMKKKHVCNDPNRSIMMNITISPIKSI